MTEIFIGTSGFSYNDWRNVFYPPHLPASNFLTFYSKEFHTVEINFSYYRIRQSANFTQMLEKSEHKLQFVIKAFGGLTHNISDQSIPVILPKFKDSILPFWEHDKLGAVLLQFPQRFHYTPKSRIYLESLINGFMPFPVCIEFRQREWLKDSVYKKLREMDAAFACVDEPSLKGLLPPIAVATSGIGYVRFHGRNQAKWYSGNSEERYDYLYTENELKEWLPRINVLSGHTEKIFIFFNNHRQGQAIKNARMMIGLLQHS